MIKREMGKLNTHRPIYYNKNNWENWLNLKTCLDKMYLTSIVEGHDLQVRVHNDDEEEA